MIIKKLISGGIENKRKTRFHDERGQKILIKDYKNLIRSIKSFFIKKITSKIPEYPWLPYSATKFIINHFEKFENKNILEFGAGCSTIFFSKNLSNVYSKEDLHDWYNFLKEKLSKKKLKNTYLEFCREKDNYLSINKNWPDKYDIILIDGSWRDECLKLAFERIKNNTLIVLDNSDKFAPNDASEYPDDITGNVFKAREDLVRFSKENNFQIKKFTDFSPCNLYVHECLIVVCNF
tara:strand:- start:1028 stop:1735 length:708 start_codon:yes stop_codon:yes gene_type:complete